jgi:hypothetical protein
MPCVNWAGGPIKGFTIHLLAPIHFKEASLGSGGAVHVTADKVC